MAGPLQRCDLSGSGDSSSPDGASKADAEGEPEKVMKRPALKKTRPVVNDVAPVGGKKDDDDDEDEGDECPEEEKKKKTKHPKREKKSDKKSEKATKKEKRKRGKKHAGGGVDDEDEDEHDDDDDEPQVEHETYRQEPVDQSTLNAAFERASRAETFFVPDSIPCFEAWLDGAFVVFIHYVCSLGKLPPILASRKSPMIARTVMDSSPGHDAIVLLHTRSVSTTN